MFSLSRLISRKKGFLLYLKMLFSKQQGSIKIRMGCILMKLEAKIAMTDNGNVQDAIIATHSSIYFARNVIIPDGVKEGIIIFAVFRRCN